MELIINLLKDESMKAAIIGALGSIVGGFIGVIGSLIVFRVQRKKELSDELINLEEKYKKIIKLLIIEIDYNISILKIINNNIKKEDYRNIKEHLESLEEQVRNKFSYDLVGYINEDLYIHISYIYRDMNFIKNHKLEEYKKENVNYNNRINTMTDLKNKLCEKIENKNEYKEYNSDETMLFICDLL